MATNVILARMGEVTLKGLNRGRFESQLMGNLRYRLRQFGKLNIFQSQSRIWIEAKEEGNPYFENDEAAKELMVAVTQVFGIVSVSLARKFEGDINDIDSNAREYVASYLEHNPSFKTFKVECKRGNKSFPMNSPMICEEVGYFILENFKELSVDVHNPDFCP
jgi:Thiamine biosynthesis ATP pyrophosphatase